MNLPSHNNHDNTLFAENSTFLGNSETTNYGLETAEVTSSTEQQLNSFDSSGIVDELDSSGDAADSFGDGYSQVVFIDSTIEEPQILIDNISGATEVIVLDDNRDEILQIDDYIANAPQSLDAIHIVSLGESGLLSFANTTLNSDTLAQYSSILESWRNSLDADADIVLYGCDVSSGNNGNSFVRQLSQATGADILASVDKTGRQGDWDLETAVGTVEASSIFHPEISNVYQSTFDSEVITITPGILPDFNNVDFGNTNFDFGRIAVEDLTLFVDAGLDFGNLDPNTLSQIDYTEIPTDDLVVLADAGLNFSNLNSEAVSQLDFVNIPTDNLQVLADAGINFGNLNSEVVIQLDFVAIPTENLGILVDSGLDLSNITADAVSQIDYVNIPADNLQILTEAGLNFGNLDSINSSNIDFQNIPLENLQVLANGGINFGNLDPNTLSQIDYSAILAEDLQVLTNAGLNFSSLSSETVSQLDFASIPTENFSILVNSGLSLSDVTADAVSQIDFNNTPVDKLQIYAQGGLRLDTLDGETLNSLNVRVLENFNYLADADFAFNSFNGDTTFGELSDLVVANANLFSYKPDLDLESGLTLEKLDRLSPSDLKALDFAFPEDFRFDAEFYLENNPDVADDGINPFTQYFLSGADEGRDPNVGFDSSYYLRTNPDVAGDGINPFFHFYNSGTAENRDPDAAFDVDFYLSDNPDVAGDGINPLIHYFSSGINEEGRFANATFKAFESGEAWAISPDLSGEEFNEFKNAVKDLAKEGNSSGDTGLFLGLIRTYVEFVEYSVTFQAPRDALEAANSLDELLEGVENIFIFPRDPELTKEDNLEKFPLPGIGEVNFGTPPFDDGEVIGIEDNVFFPKGDGFLDDILNGRYEFPDEGEIGFNYFVSIDKEITSYRGIERQGNLSDPTLTDYERTIGQSLSDEGNLLLGVDDNNVRKALGVPPRSEQVADYLSVTPSGKFNLTEVKGSEPGSSGAEVGKAINQLRNTYNALQEKVPGAKLGKVEVAVPEGAPLEAPYQLSGNQIVRKTAEGTEVVRVGGKVVTIRR